MFLCCACAETPDNVKGKTENSQTIENVKTDIKKVSVSELDDNSATVAEYIEENGYSDKFIISDSVNVNSVSELYNLTLTQITDMDEYFPQIYETYFGSDFTADSGCNSISDLPLQSGSEGKTLEFVYNDEDLIKGVDYIDLSTYSEDAGTYTTSLSVGATGFLYYEKDYTFFETEDLTQVVRFDRNNHANSEYKMTNGKTCSITSAAEFAEEMVNDVYGIFDTSFKYTIKSAEIYNVSNDNNYFIFKLQKEYCGVPFLNATPQSYASGETRSKNMYYEAIMYEPDKITETDAPYGFEKIYSSEEIKDGVIPLTSAIDILNKELAANIRLEISDIKLVYFNEYNASDVEKAEKLDEKRQAGEKVEMTEEQDLACCYPELVGGREYTCYPVWAFIIDKDDESKGLSSDIMTDNCDFVLVNVQTGEVITQLS